jgi:hypothetical protein
MAFQLYPSFNFNESNVGPRPVLSVTRERVGMAAPFTYSPGAPTVADPDTAKLLFGTDTSVGSVHMQAVLDQGVPDILISPVWPAARVATYSATFTGPTSASGTATLRIDPGSGGTILTAPITIASGETAAAFAAAVVVAAGTLTGAAATVTQPDATTGGLLFTSNVAGAAGNLVQVEITVTGATGLVCTPSAFETALQPLAGGIDAPTYASVTLSDATPTPLLKLVSLPLGTSGNATTATVAASLNPGRFDLFLDNNVLGIHEIYHDVDLTDYYDENKLAALRSSLLANGIILAATSVPTVGTRSFTAGANGDSVLTTADYLAAIDALAYIQCTVICAPGLKANTISQASLDAELIAQAENGDVLSGELVGLRVAVTSVPRNSIGKTTFVADFATLRTGGRIGNSKRNVCVVGWGTSARVQKFKRFGVDPSAPYAGHLVATDNYLSPAARTSSPSLKGLIETDCPTSVPALNEITRNRCEALYFDPAMNAFACLNGRTTSSDPAWYWVSTRRVYDEIRTDIFFNFQWTKSEPNNADLDRKVQSGVDAYLGNRKASNHINGYSPTVSNETNNKDRTQPRLVDIYIEPLYPNDKTQFNLNRVQQASIRIA